MYTSFIVYKRLTFVLDIKCEQELKDVGMVDVE